MSKYSRVNLLEKALILNCAMDQREDPALLHHSQLYVLLAAKVLAARKEINCTSLSIALFLRANKRGVSRALMILHLATLSDAGYIICKGPRVIITEAGKAALNDLETILRTTHVKQRRYQDTTSVAPGRKRSKA